MTIPLPTNIESLDLLVTDLERSAYHITDWRSIADMYAALGCPARAEHLYGRADYLDALDDNSSPVICGGDVFYRPLPHNPDDDSEVPF